MLPVIAEGIETERQLVMARALGATHGQGRLFGRPERMAMAGGALAGIAGLPVPRCFSNDLASPSAPLGENRAIMPR